MYHDRQQIREKPICPSCNHVQYRVSPGRTLRKPTTDENRRLVQKYIALEVTCDLLDALPVFAESFAEFTEAVSFFKGRSDFPWLYACDDCKAISIGECKNCKNISIDECDCWNKHVDEEDDDDIPF